MYHENRCRQMSFRLDAFWGKLGHVLEMVVYPVCNGVGAARNGDLHGGDVQRGELFPGRFWYSQSQVGGVANEGGGVS